MPCVVFVMGTNIEGVPESLSILVGHFLSPLSLCFLVWHSPCISIFESSRGHLVAPPGGLEVTMHLQTQESQITKTTHAKHNNSHGKSVFDYFSPLLQKVCTYSGVIGI